MTYTLSREELISEMEKYMAEVTLKEFSDEDIERIDVLAEACYVRRGEFDIIDKQYEPGTVVRDLKTVNPALRLMVTMMSSAKYPAVTSAHHNAEYNLKNVISVREQIVSMYRDATQEQK